MRCALVHRRHAESGGTERYLNQLAAHLAASGHRVTIVCRRHEAAPHPAVRFAALRAPALGRAGRLGAFAKAVERHVRQSDYEVVYGLGKTYTHDAIRLGGGCHATYLERAHAAVRRPWERALPFDRLANRVALRIEARALAAGSARRVVVNSEMVRRDVEKRHGVAAEAICLIRNGVDLSRFAPRRERGAALRRSCGFADDDVVILFLGTGYGRKGLDRLLEAFAAVLRTRPRARLLVVGYDSSRRAFEPRNRASAD